MRYYVAPPSEARQVRPVPGQKPDQPQQLNVSGVSRHNEARVKAPPNIIVSDDVIKVKRIKKRAITNRNSPTSTSNNQSHNSSNHNILGSILGAVFDKHKKK